MLVDGCLLDNVPIRTMHQLKSGPNVVVSFDIPELQRFDVDYAALPSRAELIQMSLNPFARRKLPEAPGLTTVLMRSLMANRHDFNRQLKPEDLLLVPPIPDDMGILDWHRHAELVEDAYRWGLHGDGTAAGERASIHPLPPSCSRHPFSDACCRRSR